MKRSGICHTGTKSGGAHTYLHSTYKLVIPKIDRCGRNDSPQTKIGELND